MSEFKGGIPLISFLKPHNGDFALLDAHHVVVQGETEQEEALRLDEKLKKVGVSEADKEAIHEAVFQDARFSNLESATNNLNTKVDSNSGNIIKITERLTEVEQNAGGDNEKLEILYDITDSTLYLFEGDNLIKPDPDNEIEGNVLGSTVIQGGSGGGSGLNYSLSIQVLDELTNGNLAFLEEAESKKIHFRAVLRNNDTQEEETLKLKFRLTVETTSGKQTYNFEDYSNIDIEYDISEIVGLGSNTLQLRAYYSEIVGDNDTPSTVQSSLKTWFVNIIRMKVENISFNDETPQTRAFPLTVRVFGDLQKTLHYVIDGNYDSAMTEEVRLTNVDITKVIPMQSHGLHSLEVYVTAEINGKVEKSESLFYNIMFVQEGNPTPILRVKVDPSAVLEEYATIPIIYNAYNPSSSITPVNIYEDGQFLISLQATEKQATYPYMPSNISSGVEEEDKTLTFTATGGVTETLVLNIKKFPYDASPVTAGLAFDFDPRGRSNQEGDTRDVFIKSGVGEDIQWTLSDNFDWINGGWKSDETGAYFLIKAGNTVTIDYKLFNDENTIVKISNATDGSQVYSKGNGKEFKITYKLSNVATSDSTWLSCEAPAFNGEDVGLRMDMHKAYVKSNVETAEIPLSEESIIEFDMNIVPPTFTDSNQIDFTVADIPMILTYEDGTPFQPKVIKSASTSFKQSAAEPITIGSKDCDVYIYKMRAYENFLSEKDILRNFQADSRDGTTMRHRYEFNDIYDKVSGELTPESVANACPNLRVFTIEAPRFTTDKKDKVRNTKISCIYRNGAPEENWIAEYAIHNGQGTTSNEYGYSGRNLEFNLKAKAEDLTYYTGPANTYYDKNGNALIPGMTLDLEAKYYDSPDKENRNQIDIIPFSATSSVKGTRIYYNQEEGGEVQQVEVKKVSISLGETVPNNYFNVKVNIASSEHGNNALMQKRYDRYLPYSTLAKLRDSKIKNSMDFYNCVIFLKETGYDSESGMSVPCQEFDDSGEQGGPKWHFYAIGNIGDSKKTDAGRANVLDDPDEFCVEIMDWNRPLANFPMNTIIQVPSKQAEDIIQESNLNILYEDINGTIPATLPLTPETKTYYVDILEYDDFSEDFTYGFRYLVDDEDPEMIAAAKAKWNEFYRFVTRDLTTDGKEDSAKVAQWKTEFEDWFIKEAALYYYLFTLRYTMVDNRAKNSFWHYGKCLDGKYRFDFWDYDNDTALGIDNTGKLNIPYGVEDEDMREVVNPDNGQVSLSPYFRAHDSVFFRRVAKYFADDIINLLSTLEQKDPNIFSGNNLIEEYDNWQNEFPEELWRLDYIRKYKRTYVGGSGSEWDNAIAKASAPRFLEEMMNGKKKNHRRLFENRQDPYMSSKFRGKQNRDHSMTLRSAAIQNAIPAPNYDLTLTPFSNMYLNVYEGPVVKHSVRAYAGEPVTLTFPPNEQQDNIYIRGASYIESVGDLSLMYLDTAELTQGSRLKTVILGNETEGYSNGMLNTLSVSSSNKLLERLNLCNIPNLKGTLGISDIPSLKYLNAKGTAYTDITFANNGLIEEAYLPRTISQIQLNNLYFLKTLEIEDTSNLASILINNCPNIDSYDLIKDAINLKRIRALNVNWGTEENPISSEVLKRILACTDVGSDTKQSVLTGTVYVDVIRQSERDAYDAAWGPTSPIEGEDRDLTIIAKTTIVQYDVTFINDGDPSNPQSVVKKFDYEYKLQLSDGPEGSGGVWEKTFGLPYPEKLDEQYIYTFTNWRNVSQNSGTTGSGIEGVIVRSNLTFYAHYSKEVKKFKVTWKDAKFIQDEVIQNGDYTIEEVEWGSHLEYPGLIPTKERSANGEYYLFTGWDTPTLDIRENLVVNPLWEVGTTTPKDLQNLTSADFYAMKSITSTLGDDLSGQPLYKNVPVGTEIKIKTGYMPNFPNWRRNGQNIERVLVDAPVRFDGTREPIVFEDIRLFENDISFTLALDIEFEYNDNKSNSTLVSCYNTTGSPIVGFHVTDGSENKPQVIYNNTGIEISKYEPTTNRSHRDICVIRKVKGSNTLYIHTHDRFNFSASPTMRTIVPEGNIASSMNPLILGSGFGYEQGSTEKVFTNSGKGTIHFAKLWYADLGEQESNKICSWIYDDFEFEFMGPSALINKDQYRVKGTFLAKYLLDEPVTYISGGLKESYPLAYNNSDLRTFLNDKVFKGLSIQWQQNIDNTTLPCIQGALTANSSTKMGVKDIQDNYLYIPAVCNLVQSISTLYYQGSEENGDPDVKISYWDENNKSASAYPTILGNEDRVRTRKGSTDVERYWTRTPHPSSNWMFGVTQSKGSGVIFGDNKAGAIARGDSIGDSNYLYYSSNQLSILLAFSI